MPFPVFNQQNYSQQLGTGPNGPTISLDGCAESDLAAVCVWFGQHTDPAVLNQALIGVNGYADNGSGQHDLLVWGAVHSIYPDISLAFNHAYPSTPADMTLIDGQLAKSFPVIVGVSYVHNPKQTQPSHYVCLYRKNADGTYQAMDPEGGKDIVFDHVYAVNGMSVGQCILQAVSYTGTPAGNTTSSPADSTASDLAACLAQHDQLVTACNEKDAQIKQQGQLIESINAQAQANAAKLDAAEQQNTTLQSLADQVPVLQQHVIEATTLRIQAEADRTLAQTDRDKAVKALATAQLNNYTQQNPSTLFIAFLQALIKRR